MANSLKERTVYRNIDISDIVTYRLPWAGWVSILHRISGALLFLLLPFIVWLLDLSLSSEASFDRFSSVFQVGIGLLPAWFVKLVCLGLIWAYLQHFLAGLRHLWMDLTHKVSKEQGRVSAIITVALTLLLTLALGARLFGIY